MKMDTTVKRNCRNGSTTYEKKKTIVTSCLESYDEHVHKYGIPLMTDIGELSHKICVGYFIRMYTLNPIGGVEYACREKYITRDKRASLITLLSQIL